MSSRDYRDIASGGLLAAFGLWFSWYAYDHYSLGTLAEMGNGIFPVSLGILLAFFGLIIAVLGFAKRRQKVDFEGKTTLFVLMGIGGFALTAGPFGLIPAIVVLTLVSSLADIGKFRAVTLMALCVVLAAMTYLVFKVGLGLAVPMANWPF